MLKAFFVRDLGSRQQAAGSRQQAAGNYTHLLSNHVNYPIANFHSILITLFLLACFYSHFFGNAPLREKERLLYICP